MTAAGRALGLFPATRSVVATTALLILCACTTLHGTRSEATRLDAAGGDFTLRLIGEQRLPSGSQFGGTTVGGLSGIDYDPAADLYYLISDDRSIVAPASFYTARLAIDERSFAAVSLQTVVTLRRPDGSPYPADTSDSEAIRYDARTHDLWWTSEGERKVGRRRARADPRLVDPFIRRSALDGGARGEVPLPPMFRITAESRGPRDNLVFEGLTLSVDGRSLWVSMEAPLIQDGPLPTMTEGAWSRFSRFDRDDLADGFGPIAAQHAYRIDPIPSVGAWTSSHAQNGVAEILAIDATRMLVLERAYVVGRGWRIRLFEADWRDATDVKDLDALVDQAGHDRPFVPMTKRLVLDLETLKIAIDNLEGLCFGPLLANGHRTLVMVSDDNFNPGQVTQFVAFEIVLR